MHNCLSRCARRAGCLCLVCSLASNVLCTTANAQQETTSWTARSASASGAQHLFVQPEFTHTTQPVTSSTDGTDFIYRPQIPTVSDSRTIRVRSVAGTVAETPSASVSTGLLRSSHETLSAVPPTGNITQAAASSADAEAQTQPPTFYDRTRAEPLVPDSESSASSDSDLIQIVEALQWTVAVLALAVLAVLVLKKYRNPQPALGSSPDIRHVATIPVKNVFQAHLLEIRGQQFLVTTDRNGVKTVTPVPHWDDFNSPLDTIQETVATQTTGTLTS